MVNNTATNPADETILSKITKLLAKAEGTNNPHEAEVFTAKAMELMMKWSVDEAMLASHRGVINRNEIVQVIIPIRGVYHQAHLDLLSQLGRAFGFRRVQLGQDRSDRTIKNRIAWIGFENDIASAQLLYTSLLVQLDHALREFVKTAVGFKSATASEKYQMRRSFILGFSDVVSRRVEASRKTAVDTTPGAGLVLASRANEVDAMTIELYPHLSKARRRSMQISGRGFDGGKVAGTKASLGGPSVKATTRGAIGR